MRLGGAWPPAARTPRRCSGRAPPAASLHACAAVLQSTACNMLIYNSGTPVLSPAGRALPAPAVWATSWPRPARNIPQAGDGCNSDSLLCRATASMERASKALHNLSSRFSRRSAVRPDAEAELQQLEAQVSAATLDALRGTSELPADAGQAGVRALLQQYLAAEKHNVHSAAQRLEQQAAWRRGFGTVSLVRSGVQLSLCSPVLAAMPHRVCFTTLSMATSVSLMSAASSSALPCIFQDEVPNQVATGKVLLQPPAGSSHRPLIVVAVRKHLPPPGCVRCGCGGVSKQQVSFFTPRIWPGNQQQSARPPSLPSSTHAIPHSRSGDLSELERFVVLVLDTAASYCWDAAGASGQHFDVLFDLRGARRGSSCMRGDRGVCIGGPYRDIPYCAWQL